MRTSLYYPLFEGWWPDIITTTTTWTKPVKIKRPASATRLVVGVLFSNGSSHTDTSLSIFGTALTQQGTAFATAAHQCSLWSGYVTTGQEGDAVAVVSAACPGWGLALFAFARASATPAATYRDFTQPSSADIALTPLAIAVFGSTGSNLRPPKPCWTGAKAIGTQILRPGVASAVSYGMIISRITETRAVRSDWDDGSSPELFAGAVWA